MSGEEMPLIVGTPNEIPLNIAGHQQYSSDSVKSTAPASERRDLTWYAATFMVINATIGAGLLDLPYAFNVAGGVAMALSAQGILIIFILTSLMILAYCSEFNDSSTYAAVLLALYGKKAETACAITITLSSFCTTVLFLTLIGDQLGRFFVFVYGDDYCKKWYMGREFTMVISSVVIILPLCFPKKMDFLKYASFLGVLATIYIVGLINAKYFMGLNNVGTVKTRPDHVTDVLTIIPAILYNYQCHVSIFPIYSRLKERNRKNFAKVMAAAYLPCVGVCTSAAVFGYYSFGDTIDPDILRSYAVSTDVIIAVLMTAAKTYLTYPVYCFCGRTEILKFWRHGRPLSEADAEKYELLRHIVVTCVWFATSLLVSLFIPNISMVINVSGGVSAIFILIFPGMCLLKIALHYIQDSRLKRRFLVCLAVFFIVFGTFTFGFVSVRAIINIFSNTSGSHVRSVCS